MIMNLMIYGIDETDKKGIYKLTKSPKIEKVSDISDNEILELQAVAFFTDMNEETETEVEITSIMTKNGDVYATNSTTFKRELKDIMGIMDNTVNFAIEKISGTSKNGRKYVTCCLA